MEKVILLERYSENRSIGREEAAVMHHAIMERKEYVFIDEDCLTEAREQYSGIIDLFVGSVEAMRIMNCGNLPPPDYYPPALSVLFKDRNVRSGTISEAKRIVANKKHVFLKPKNQWKSFTGFVARDLKDFEEIDDVEDQNVWLSDVIDIKCEFRAYVCNNELLAVCQYTAEEDYTADTAVIKSAIALLRDANYPFRTYAIDFALTHENELVLVEMNNAFAIGKYKDISDADYYKFLKAGFDAISKQDDNA